MQRLIALVFALVPLTAVATCLTHEREVALSGVVRYENSSADGRAESTPNLDLPAAICIESQRRDRIYVRREGVASVRLVVPPEMLAKVVESRSMTFLGTLSGRVTGNPRAPVLFHVRSIQNVP